MPTAVFGGSTAGAISQSVVSTAPRYSVGDDLNGMPVLRFSEFDRLYKAMLVSLESPSVVGSDTPDFLNYLPWYYESGLVESNLGTKGKLTELSLEINNWDPTFDYLPGYYLSGSESDDRYIPDIGSVAQLQAKQQKYGVVSQKDIWLAEIDEKSKDQYTIYIVVGTPPGDGRDRMCVYYIKRGDLLLPIKNRKWREDTAWVAFRKNALPIVGILIMFIPGIGQMIGSFIMGPLFATTYPAITSAIGSVAMKTALNGGDIGSAVIGTVTAGFGDVVGGIVDFPVLSDVASSVAVAAVRGDDLNNAAVSGLISGGLSNAGSLFSGGSMDDFDYGSFYDSYGNDGMSIDSFDNFDGAFDPGDYYLPAFDDFGGAFDPGSYDYPDPISYSDAGSGNYGDWGSSPTPDPANYSDVGSEGYGDWGAGPTQNPANYTDAGTTGYGDWGGSTSTPVTTGGSKVPNTSGVSFDSVLNSLSSVVKLGLQVNSAVRGQTNTTLRAGALPVGTTANTNGRLSNGQQIPVGAVYRTSNGGAVVNNGDGTYTVAQPNGQATVKNYSNNQTMGNLPTGAKTGIMPGNTLLYAGLGIGAVLLLKGMKK